jgi:hypothetical protein
MSKSFKWHHVWTIVWFKDLIYFGWGVLFFGKMSGFKEGSHIFWGVLFFGRMSSFRD